MAIAASSILPNNSLEEFRVEFNNLVTDVEGVAGGNTFTSTIVFEGATADAYETTVLATDPTADRTITLPNVTGTVLTSGNSDLGTTTTNSGDADFVLVDDGGVLKKITASNLGVGYSALAANTTASNNTAVGYGALDTNTTGAPNTAVGKDALAANTTGGSNSAFGHASLVACTTGGNNHCYGSGSGQTITTGSHNLMWGSEAGSYDGNDLTTGTKCIVIGNYSKVAASDAIHEIVMGYYLTGKGNNTVFLGGSAGAYNGENNAAFNTTSDKRIKKNIEDNNTGLDKIKQIQVKNFEYRTEDEIDELPKESAIKKEGIQIGVIAQEIMEILPDTVKQESTGCYAVNPDNLTWYLINAVKELSTKVEDLEKQLNNKE